jgi:hypothetical protein
MVGWCTNQSSRRRLLNSFIWHEKNSSPASKQLGCLALLNSWSLFARQVDVPKLISQAEEFLQSTETLQRRLLDIKDMHEDKAQQTKRGGLCAWVVHESLVLWEMCCK